MKKETDPASRDRLERLVKELEELEQRSAELTAQWRAEKDKLAGAQKLKEELDQARTELDIAQRRGDWSRAGELTYGVIPELERRLTEAEAPAGPQLEEAVTAGAHRRRRDALDRHPGRQDAVGRAREAPPTWSRICAAAWSARTRR